MSDDTPRDYQATDIEESTKPKEAPLARIERVTQENNIVEEIDADTLSKLAMQVQEDYETDKDSMGAWSKASQRGIDLAKLIKTDKTYPFANASNIKYPLITSAALHYNARTYPAIVPAGSPVAAKVNGSDDDGRKAARGERVSEYASHQLKNEIANWEEDMDRLTFIGPIVGTMFKKIWFDPALDENRSKLCKVDTVVVNNQITSLSQAPAITEELTLYQHEIVTRIRAGVWADELDKLALPIDDRSKPVEFIEQHMRYDLDDDGYSEPYIVTMHKDTRTIMRVVANFTPDDVQITEDGKTILTIKPSMYFVDYHFLPSFDGGFFGSGLGMLLGDISEAVNSTMNMLMDSGHFQAMPSGFIGAKDMRMKSGTTRFSPGEWKQVPVRGDDIRKSMVELSMPQPSTVLFQMLGLMIDMGKEISSSNDISSEKATQLTATTTMALIDQGMQVFNASYKRIYRSLKKEFALLFKLNERFLSSEKYTAFFDEVDQQGQPVQYDAAEEFGMKGMDLTPVADPKAVTDMQRMSRAQFLLELAQGGLIDQAAAVKRVLEAGHIEDIEELMPQADPQAQQMQQQMQEMQMLDASLSIKLKAADIDLKLSNAIKNIAQAEGEEDGRQMQEYITGLQAMKQEIENHQQMKQQQETPPNDQRGTGLVAQ